MTHWWGVALCPPELNDIALAEIAVYKMRMAARRVMEGNEERRQPTLKSILEYQRERMIPAPEATPHENKAIYERARQIAKFTRVYKQDLNDHFGGGCSHPIHDPVAEDGGYIAERQGVHPPYEVKFL